MVVVGGDNDDTLIKVMDSSLETNNHSSSSSQVKSILARIRRPNGFKSGTPEWHS